MDTNSTLTLQGKALSAVPTSSGDLVLTGMAALWEGLDFQDENFLRGAFREAIPAFLSGQAPLLFHHKGDHGIGRVLELDETAEGLRFKALVTKQEPTSPLYFVYDAIRRGVYRGVSVGGFFRRQMTEGGRRIAQARMTELSITPVAMHPGTYATATEVKAWNGAVDLDALSQRATLLELDLLAMQIRRDLRAAA